MVKIPVLLMYSCLLAGAAMAQAQAPSRQQVLGADRALWAAVKSVDGRPQDPPADWTVITDPNFRVTLAFPCVPQRDTVPAPLVIVRARCGVGPLYFLVSYGPQIFSDPYDPDEFHAGTDFALISELAQNGLRARAVPEMRLSYLGLHGRQVRIESEKIQIRKRTLVRKTFSIQMQASGPPGSSDARVEQFFDSFRIGD